ncbi:MAG: (d)CMP kinase [Bacteroidia bacterium]
MQSQVNISNSRLIIAIDGYSSCGKSTIARSLAVNLGYVYVDSGAMYRAVTLYFLDNKIGIPSVEEWQSRQEFYQSHLNKITIDFRVNQVTGKSMTFLNDKNVESVIREMRISENVSQISKIKDVREFLVKQQKRYGAEGGVVMDGRDIGTVVFPNADVKIFMTASPEIRANRRYLELQEVGIVASEEEILNNLIIRDHEDSTREEAPLAMAEDSVLMDNSHLTHDEQLQYVMELVNERIVQAG